MEYFEKVESSKQNRKEEFQLEKGNIPKSTRKMFQLEKGNTELRFGKTFH